MQSTFQATDGSHYVRYALRQSTFLRSFVGIALCVSMLCTFTFVFLQHNRAAHADVPTQKPHVGVNMGEPSWGTFTDAMKTSRNQWSREDGTKGNAPLDANGWPMTDAGIVVWEGVGKTDGTYQVIFQGQATLTPLGLSATISNQQYNATTNTTTATLVVTTTTPNNFYFKFTNTKRTASSATDTGITNLQIFRPVSEGSTTSYAPSTIFTPYVAQAVASYTYLRFMFGTNWNKSVTWSDRTTINYATQHKVLPGESGFEGNQMAFEYMVKMCNDTNKDMYVVVPDRANNDYITKLAQLILYGSDGLNPYTSVQANPVWAPLKSNLHLYVEYTNEAWNFSFDQAHDLYDGAQAEIKSNPHSPLIYDGTTNGNIIWYRNYANHALNVSTIFRSVFGDAAMGNRVRPLLFWQYGNLNGTAEYELQFLTDYYDNADGTQHVSNPHPVNYYFWGGGGAVYFNSNNDNAPTVDALFASGIPSQNYQNTMNIEGTWARSYGLHFMSYEGSWGISGTVGGQGRVDPRAKQAFIDSFNDFVKAGGENYTAGTFGQWDDFTIANTYPLVQGAATVNAPNYTPPAITLGSAISTTSTTTIPGTSYAVSLGWPVGPTSNLGKHVIYLLNVKASDTYTFYLSVGNNAAGGKINIYADDALLTTLSVPDTGSTTAYHVVPVGSAMLTPGLHSFFLRPSANASGGNAGSINAVFVNPSSVKTQPSPLPAPNGVPSYLQQQDLGGPAQPGYTATNNGVFSITAAGYDIWYGVDAFHFVYEPINGDATIIARVASLGNSSEYAKAGVMIRETLDPGAPNALAVLSPQPAAYFQDRLTAGGNTAHPASIFALPPYWLKLVRAGNTFTGYGSTDGSTWTQLGTATITMSNTVYIGLAVTAHNDATLENAVFDHVSVNGTAWTGNGTGTTTTPTPTATATPTPTPTATATPTPGHGFSTSFEDGQPQPTWTNTVDSAYPGGGIQNVGGICCNLTGPEAGVRHEKAHTGKAALMYSGLATSTSASATLKVFDLSSQAITVDATTTLEYWINPRTNFGSTNIAANSTCVALDVVFSDGSTLRSSGAVDQNGNPATPAGQCTKLTDETWNHVVIKLGTNSAGKQIVRVDLGVQPSSTGGYRGYIDDISIHE